jgi:uncharacterized repeat protein (TIGR01451 family)
MKINNPRTATFILILTLSLNINVRTQALEPQTLFNFQLSPGSNGFHPEAGLTLGPDGNFYGTTHDGGSDNVGTIFKVTTNGTLTTLVAFNGTNGAAPQGGLALGKDGNFYGTTTLGGSDRSGTVFRFSTNGILTTLASFNKTNGANPQCQLAMDASGNFYGTASEQGPNGLGTIFRITTNGVLTTLVSFADTNGALPEDGLTLGNDGNFYGTTANGGSKDLGTVFKMTPDGVLTTIFSFDDTNEVAPLGGLVQGRDGDFYGTTGFGGTNLGRGTIFKITTNGVLETLFTFHFTDGGKPSGKLIFGNDGNLYGTTGFGGSTTNDPAGSGLGTVFQITTNGAFISLVQFQGTNGSNPHAPLVLGNDGNLYGTTALGGPGGGGTIFRVVLMVNPAQEVTIPDLGLNAAIREALQKPTGPLTEQDLLSLTNLTAESRNISSLQGLEAAHNLSVLVLESNQLTNVAFPNGLTNLNFLDLSFNPLTSLTLSTDMTNLTELELFSVQLTSLTVPAELSNLMGMDLSENLLTSINLPSTLARLDFLDLSVNRFTDLTFPSGLTALTDLELWANQLTSLILPEDMTNLVALRVSNNQLKNLILPADLKSLRSLDLDNNQFTSFNVPSNLSGLFDLEFRGNRLTNVTFQAAMTNLEFLFLNNNQLKILALPAGMTRLSSLQLNQNQLTSFNLPVGMTNLKLLALGGNQTTNLTLSADLGSLAQLDLENNQLTNLTLPAGLTNLAVLVLEGNQLTNLTLPPDLTKLATLLLDGNPLTTLVLSESLAATNLADLVASLRNQGVSVITFPLTAAPTANLEVITLASPSPISIASNLTYTIAVINRGPDTATFIMLTNVLPANVSFVAASDECTNIDGLVVCDLGSLTNGEATDVTLMVVPTLEDSLTNLATVAAAEADPNPANNTSVDVTQVFTVPPPPHDIAVVKLKAPKKIALSAKTASKVGKFIVTIQNLGPETETIPDLAALNELVTVEAETLGTICASLAPTLVPPRALFPISLAPNEKLTLAFQATFDCANDPLATTRTAAHNDYTTAAAVDLSALGEVDTASANDICPRPPNPATGDPGCSNKDPVIKQHGAPVFTDVVVKQ